MRTLITGGTGFIGAEIARMILAADPNADLHVTTRSNNLGRLAGIEDQVQLHHFDLADRESIEQVFSDVAPQRMYHFGAMLTGPGEADPQTLLELNAVGYIHTIEAARQAGVGQMIFASSIGTYGRDTGDGPLDDLTLQRPHSVYGVTKVFGENLGAYYRQKYDLDYRGIRYPSIVGPGVTTWSLAQYTSWMIEKPALGEAFEVWVPPEQLVAIQYYKDAARAAIELADAPADDIKSINYLVNGPTPTPTAQEMVDAVKAQLPDADLGFAAEPDALPRMVLVDDSGARNEWGWEPSYDLDSMISEMIAEAQGAVAQ